MAERIEWEAIERRKEIAQVLDAAIGGRADCSGSAAVNRDWLRYIAALEAAEAALVDLKEDHDMSVLEGHAPERCDGCKLFAAWRRCVAPRGEGA